MEVQRQVAALTVAVSQLSELVTELRVEMKSVVTQMKFTTCPSPGACVNLAKDLKDLADEVRSLQAAHDQKTGERTVLVAIGSFVGAILSGIVTYWLTSKH